MIKKLLIQNFQKHHKRAIEFDPITVIVGPTDSGKSSIIRSMRWVAFNNPAGMAFIRKGAKGCSVTMINDEHIIRRKRSKSTNAYEVDGKRLDAILRGSVPEEVIDSLRLDDINFQSQHDSPLWLTENAGQVAKNLNEIVNLDLIDRVLNRVHKEARSVKSELDSSLNRLAKAQEEKDSLEWVEKCETEYSAIESLEKEIENLSREHTKLYTLIKQADQALLTAKKLSKVVKPATKELEEIHTAQRDLESKTKDHKDLKTLIAAIEVVEAQKNELKDQAKKERAKIKDVEVCPVCEREWPK